MSEAVYLVITKRMDDGLFLTEGVTDGITDAEVLELAAEDWYAVAEMGTKKVIRGDPESRLAAATEAIRRMLFWEQESFHDTNVFAREFGVEPAEFPESSSGMDYWLEVNVYGPAKKVLQ